jgi:hypothetical protein
MGSTISQRIVEQLPWLDGIAEELQPKVQQAIDKGGVALRNVLDGVWFEAPLHPVLSDVPLGSWTATMMLDAVDLVSGSRAVRNAADGSLVVGVAGGFAAAVVGLSD